MGLFDRISNLFKKEDKAVETTAEPTLPTSGNSHSGVTDVYAKLKADQDRIAVIKTCRTMYETDSRVKKSLRTYSRDLVRSGFFIKTANVEAAKIASDLQKRLNLNRKLQDVVKLGGRDGDSFYELVVDENFFISEISRKPTLRMRRNSNQRDSFDNPMKAFYMVPNDVAYDNQIPKDAMWFSEWQMIHVRNDHDEEKRYGTPMWASSTGAFKKMTEGEMDVAVRRKVRAGMRYQHVVEGSEADLLAYKEINKIALSNPMAAQVDFFSNKAGSLTAVQGDAHLNEINDILHHISTSFFASETPMELLGYGNDLNRDVLGEKKAEYDETLNDGRDWITVDFIVPLIERQWLLQGILPASVDYKVIWRKARLLSAMDLKNLVDALMRLQILLSAMGADKNIIPQLLAQFLPDVDLEILTGDGVDAERFSAMLQGLSI